MSVKLVFNEQDRSFKKHSIPDRKLSARQVRVRPKYVGICGSDLSKIHHDSPHKAIGHEWVGVVDSVGKDVCDLKVNDTVTSPAHISCGECNDCVNDQRKLCKRVKLLGDEQSVLASSCDFHESDLIKISNELSLQEAALLEVAFIGDCAYEKACSLGSQSSDEVLVFGAGAVGFFSAAAFKQRGYKPIVVEVSKERREFAKKYFETISFAEIIMSPNFLSRFDLVVDCTGDVYGPGALSKLPLFCKVDANVVIVGKYKEAQLKESLWADRSLKVAWVANHKASHFVKSIEFWKTHIKEYARDFITEFQITDINKAFDEALSRKHQKCLLRIDLED